MAKVKEKRYCLNCGKDISNKPSHQKCCSKECDRERRMRNNELKGFSKEEMENRKNRPLTNQTIYIVKMWLRNGDSVESIADVLSRNICTIQAIADGVTDKELIPLEE